MVEDPITGVEARNLFRALPDPAFLLDRRGAILDMNGAAEAAQDRDAAGLRGALLQEALATECGAQVSGALARAVADRACVTIECLGGRNGRPVHEEVRFVPLASGEVLALVRDITERKLAEEAMRESDAQFRVVTQNITDAFWIRSPDMREVRYVSPAFERIWGRPASFLYGNPHLWADFIVAEDREYVVRTFAGLTGDARSLDVEYRILRPDGEVRWVRARGFQVRDAQDRLVCHTGIVTDVTDRKLAQAELDAAHKQLVDASRRAGHGRDRDERAAQRGQHPQQRHGLRRGRARRAAHLARAGLAPGRRPAGSPARAISRASSRTTTRAGCCRATWPASRRRCCRNSSRWSRSSAT